MLNKFGELVELTTANVQDISSVFSDPAVDERFRKFASELRRIAPKADDFLYFSAVIITAAEAAAYNADGSSKLDTYGQPVKVSWEIDKRGSWKWISSDPSVRAYKNNNGDIFPEAELLKAHALWRGRPLCVDHRSSSVDAIRGVILDTYYDRKHKHVIALCALDKVAYPELARGVSTGYKTSVSMGTAVAKAICYDCGNVASTEPEFCQHMRTKSTYGEINTGLQPIELSLVASPADPAAKIRTIIAAANTLNNSLSSKEQEIQKLSDASNLSPEQRSKIEDLETDLKKANDKLAELKSLMDDNTAEGTSIAPYGASSGRYNEPADETNVSSTILNLPQRMNIASDNSTSNGNNDTFMGELKNLRLSIEARLSNMENALTNLRKHEDPMADNSMNKEAYFQGAGGVNEPTPGKPKYEKDPLNEKARSEDKHMNGESPFPDVGSVDGMHPSPSSADQKDELARKKLLLRAEEEERSMRRAAALVKAKENLMKQKEAYFQGGGGVNEPTPGTRKYPADPLNEKDRDKEDKQMVGQKPFPGVGDVDGLHPSPLSADEKDELKRKQLLQRASLKARFVRVANADGTDNLGQSAWHVFAKSEDGEKLVFTASVDEITGGRSDALFDVVATKEFGSKLIGKIRTDGLSKAASLYKKAQANVGPGSNPGAADMGGPGAVPAMDAAPAPDAAPPAGEDKGGEGDPKETALKLAEQVRDSASDLLEAVRGLTGEKSEMGDMEQGLEALPKAASATLRPLANMRKQLNDALISGMKKSIAELNEHAEELELIASVVDSGTSLDKEYVGTVIDEAFVDAGKAIEDAEGLKTAHAKYISGTAGLVKRAEEAGLDVSNVDDENDARKAKKSKKSEESSEDESSADDENDARKKAKKSTKSTDDEDDCMADDKESEEDESCADDENDARKAKKSKKSEESSEDESSADDMNNAIIDDLAADFEDDALVHDLNAHEHDMGLGHEDHDTDLDTQTEEGLDLDSLELPSDGALDHNEVMMDVDPASLENHKVKLEASVEPDLTTKEGRAAYRAKLANDATGKEISGEVEDASKIKFAPIMEDADRLADGQTKLDTKPSDSLGLVETKPERNKRMLEVAKMPPKVRKEAERLNQFIVEGKVKEADLDALVKEGLDSEVVKYWRQYWGEAGKEGSEFAKQLTTETFKAKMAEEMTNYKVKLGRAYEVAGDMVRRGLLADDRMAVSAQVEEIMKWNDDAFGSMQRVIAKHSPVAIKKEASVPMVGLIGSGDNFSTQVDTDLASELDRAFSSRKY